MEQGDEALINKLEKEEEALMEKRKEPEEKEKD